MKTMRSISLKSTLRSFWGALSGEYLLLVLLSEFLSFLPSILMAWFLDSFFFFFSRGSSSLNLNNFLMD